MKRLTWIALLLVLCSVASAEEKFERTFAGATTDQVWAAAARVVPQLKSEMHELKRVDNHSNTAKYKVEFDALWGYSRIGSATVSVGTAADGARCEMSIRRRLMMSPLKPEEQRQLADTFFGIVERELTQTH